MYKLQYTATNPEITNWWQNSYKLISRANDVIAHVPSINMDVTSRNNIVGNAYFLRAMAYFDLVRSFGDVPLLAAPDHQPFGQQSVPPAAHRLQRYTSRSFPISNMRKPIVFPNPRSLPPIKGWCLPGAASAMLARVYLQRASSAYADPADNQNALNECNTVINSGVYSLMPVYSDVFNWSKKYYPTQTEVIFAVQFGANGSGTTQNITCRMFSPSGLGGSGSFVAKYQFLHQWLSSV